MLKQEKKKNKQTTEAQSTYEFAHHKLITKDMLWATGEKTGEEGDYLPW